MLVSVADGWTMGCCANCEADLDPWASRRPLYRSERCRQFAKDVRYFRRIARRANLGAGCAVSASNATCSPSEAAPRIAEMRCGCVS